MVGIDEAKALTLALKSPGCRLFAETMLDVNAVDRSTVPRANELQPCPCGAEKTIQGQSFTWALNGSGAGC